MIITRVGMARTICHRVLMKPRVSFNGLESSNEFLLECSHSIEKSIDVFVDIIDVLISVTFELYFDKELI